MNNNNFENENNGMNNINGFIPPANMVSPENKENDVLEEKKTKKKIWIIVLIAIAFLLIGIISGFFILKGLNGSVKENSFMYDILNKSGLLMSNNNEYATDSDYASDSNSDLNDESKLNFIQEKNGYKYYYYQNEDGDYLYYYSDSDTKDIYYYYASDPDGYYINQSYKDPQEPEYFTVPDFTKMSVEELDGYWEVLNIIYVPNSAYKTNEVYYQSIKAGDKIPLDEDGWFSYTVTVLVNQNEPADNE